MWEENHEWRVRLYSYHVIILQKGCKLPPPSFFYWTTFSFFLFCRIRFLFFFRPSLLNSCSSFSLLRHFHIFLLSSASFSCSLNLSFFFFFSSFFHFTFLFLLLSRHLIILFYLFLFFLYSFSSTSFSAFFNPSVPFIPSNSSHLYWMLY